MLRFTVATDGSTTVERWDPDGRPVSGEELAARDAASRERMGKVAKVLEVPLTLIFTGLK